MDMQRLRIMRIIARHGITATSEHVGQSQMDSARFRVWQDDWKVTLRRRDTRQRMTVEYHMGEGHNGAEPEVADVLESLTLDATAYENAGDFESFCSEFGYDTDSRRAERMYKACERTYGRLVKFLGYDDAHGLMYGFDEEEELLTIAD